MSDEEPLEDQVIRAIRYLKDQRKGVNTDKVEYLLKKLGRGPEIAIIIRDYLANKILIQVSITMKLEKKLTEQIPSDKG